VAAAAAGGNPTALAATYGGSVYEPPTVAAAHAAPLGDALRAAGVGDVPGVVAVLSHAAAAECARRRAAALLVECAARGLYALGSLLLQWAAGLADLPRDTLLRLPAAGAPGGEAAPPALPSPPAGWRDIGACIAHAGTAAEWRLPTAAAAAAATAVPPARAGSCLAVLQASLPHSLLPARSGEGGDEPLPAPPSAPAPAAAMLARLHTYVTTGSLLTPLGQRLGHPAAVLQFVTAMAAVAVTPGTPGASDADCGTGWEAAPFAAPLPRSPPSWLTAIPPAHT